MSCQILVHRLARLDLSEAFAWAYRRAPQTADHWLARFREAISTLEVSPQRCPLAVENRKVGVEIREFHFGRRPNVFRVIFHVDDKIVRILRIRRGQRAFLTRHQIADALQADDSPELD